MTATQNINETAHGLEVGTIIHVSGGYDQTYYTFYQVVEVKGSTKVILRELQDETVRDVAWATREIRPVKDAFKGEPLTCIFKGNYSGFFRSKGKLFTRTNLNRVYTETSYG